MKNNLFLRLNTKALAFITAFTCLGFSNSSQASLAVQTLYGAGHGDFSSMTPDGDILRNRFSTTKMSVETHLDPFKSIPVTLGLFYSTFKAETEVPDLSLQQISGFDYGWDILTWTRVKGFGLSFRYGQALGGQYQFFVDNGDGGYTTSVFQVKNSFVGIGLATPVSDSFGVLLEYRQRIESSFFNISKKDTEEFTPTGFDGGMVMLGIEVSV
ncbi:hypothetical protein N9W79_01030 [bacterium]|nr:hypothetical protein [bacterium]MDB2447185.1 hypothetical protein [bacterium]